MYRDQVVFECPYKHSTFNSKSFAAFKLVLGMNYAKWLGLGELKPSNKATAIPIDFKENLVIELPSDDWYSRIQEARHEVLAPEVAVPKTIVEMKLAGAMAENPPIVRVVEPTENSEGTVTFKRKESDWDFNTKLIPKEHQSAIPRCKPSSPSAIQSISIPGIDPSRGAPPAELTGNISMGDPVDFVTSELFQSMNTTACHVDLIPTEKMTAMFDEIDALSVRDRTHTASGNLSFAKTCKEMGMNFDTHAMYRTWLIDEMGFDPDLIEFNRSKVASGTRFPFPSGSKWNKIKEEGSRKHRRANHIDIDQNQEAETEALDWIESEIKSQRDSFAREGKYVFSVQKARYAMSASTQDFKKMKSKLSAKKQKRTKAIAMGKKPDPSNARDALTCEDAEDWVKAMDNEFQGLVDMGVLELGFTGDQLIELGILSKPVPCGLYFTRKYGGDEGKLIKNKVRCAVQGHPGNMQKGVHYDKTFSATPQESTCRLICALVVLYNLFRGAFDITKAFCWADLPPGDQIALGYPEGYKQFDKDGNPLFMILRKNLYGHPAAGRQYGIQRDNSLLQKFNEQGWKCIRTRMDPCLFRITRVYKDELIWCLILVHVDDCDIAAQSQQMVDDVVAVCATIWDCTKVDPDHMLGVRRRITRDETTGYVHSCEIDMVPFVEGMYKAFSDRMPGKSTTLPIDASFEISMADVVPDSESRAVLDAGYQCAMGMLLWAARRVYSTIRVGVSVLCRVMSKPSWKAFYGAMSLIRWVYDHRNEGLLFTNSCPIPFGMVDASNKPDRKDGKCQFGFVFMFMGAVIMDVSKKLRHVGLSSEHNEYMAMAFAHQSLIWLRQLLEELDLTHLIEEPTVMFEDNKPAILLSQEDMVSFGNQYMYLPYHFNKEVQEEGHSVVTFVSSGMNISDLMTKCVGTKEFKTLSRALTGYDTSLVDDLFKIAYSK